MRHSGTSAKHCPLCNSHVRACQTMLERDLALSLLERKHRAAMNRRDRDDAMKSLGLTKAKGNNGGTFWE